MPGLEISLEEIIVLKTKLTEWGLLDPRFSPNNPGERETHNVDWYPLCSVALEEFLKLFNILDTDGIPDKESYGIVVSKGSPPEYRATTEIERRIIQYYKRQGWYIARGSDQYNVLFVEDLTREWKPVDGKIDYWDDVAIIWQAEHSGKARIIEQFNQITTEPGKYYTYQPINIDGAARIAFGQYKAWVRGLHGSGRSAHQGFREELPITVHRDLNKDGSRTGDKRQTGVFYCNWHTTVGAPGFIGRWSAGCTVFRFASEFRKFMSQLESDVRYQCDRSYAFIGAYAPGDLI